MSIKDCAFDIETEVFNAKLNKHLFNVNFICGAVVAEGVEEYWVDANQLARSIDQYDIIYTHNGTFDVNVLNRMGIDVNCSKIYDTYLMAWLLDENDRELNLNAVALKYLGEGKTQSVKKGFVPSLDQETRDYVVQDARITYKLGRLLRQKLEEQGLLQLYEEIDAPFMWLLNEATKEGAFVDQQSIDNAIRTVTEEVSAIKEKYANPPYNVNIDSPKQVWKCLYQTTTNIPKHKDKITPKTDAKTIASVPAFFLREESKEIMAYRGKAKYLSTFLEGAKTASSQDGLIHPLYNICGTRTGRISSGGNQEAYPYSFNIQNVTNKNSEVRRAIITKPGTKIVVIDAAQLELRVLAHYSKDPVLFRVFREGLDPHTITGSLLFEKDPVDVSKSERSMGKTINFSVLYGSTEQGLEHNSGLTPELADKLLRTFYEKYASVAQLKEWVHQELVTKGYITSLYGRRRRFPDYRGGSSRYKEECLKYAFSALIQGTAMDLMKECANNALPKLPKEYRFFLQEHDAFGFYVPEDRCEAALKEIIDAFSNLHRPYKVGIVFEGGIGNSWWEAKHGED